MVAGCGQQSAPAPKPAEPAKPAEPPKPAEPEEIRIGSWQPFTGALAAGGAMNKEGIDMAFEQRPKILGKPVKVIFSDNKSDKVEAANSMARLIEQDKVVAVLGCYGSSLAIAGLNVSEKAGIPMIPDASNPLVTEGRKFVTRLNYQDPFAGKVMAKYAVDKLGAKTAAIIQDVAQDYSVGLAQFFRKEFTKLTNNPNSIVAFVSYNTGDQDFTAQLTFVKSKKPDVIFVPGYSADGALLAKQAREMGIKTPLVGGDAWEAPELVQIGGKAVEGLIFCSHFAVEAAKTDKAKKFIDDYRKKYNKDPNCYAALAYDAYNLVADKLEEIKVVDPVKLNTALRSTKNWEGVTGTISIDETGNPVKPAIIFQVKGGKFVYMDTIQPW
ncbi:MAG: ABC transporter substrate-binding protein [Firmicutes bacterium]|nr:ABC transporter substrate-binding protein [Bacillota bacterium]